MAFWTWTVLLNTQSTTLTWTHSLGTTNYVYRMHGISNLGFTFKQPLLVGSGANHILIYLPGVQDPTPVQVEVQVIPTSSIVVS